MGLFKDVPEGIYPVISLSVFTNSDLFSDWFKHFTDHVKPMEDEKVLLILDKHISHCSLEAVIFCTGHCLTLLSLTSKLHSQVAATRSRFLQATVHAAEADKWINNHPNN
jgi:hypothetical protein